MTFKTVWEKMKRVKKSILLIMVLFVLVCFGFLFLPYHFGEISRLICISDSDCTRTRILGEEFSDKNIGLYAENLDCHAGCYTSTRCINHRCRPVLTNYPLEMGFGSAIELTYTHKLKLRIYYQSSYKSCDTSTSYVPILSECISEDGMNWLEETLPEVTGDPTSFTACGQINEVTVIMQGSENMPKGRSSCTLEMQDRRCIETNENCIANPDNTTFSLDVP